MSSVAVVVPPFFEPSATSYPAVLLENEATKIGYTVTFELGNCIVAKIARGLGLKASVVKRFYRAHYAGDLSVLPLLPNWTAGHDQERRECAHWVGIEWDDLSVMTQSIDTWITGAIKRLKGADIVAITATHFGLAPSVALIDALRESGYLGYVVLGGYFPSPDAASLFFDKYQQEIDAVVYGEAEGIWPSILDSRPQGVVFAPPSSLTLSASDHLPYVRAMEGLGWQASDITVSVEATRGCYWDKCDFCNFNAGYQPRGMKTRPPEVVLSEMDDLSEQGISRFQFLDTSLPISVGRALERMPWSRRWQVFCEIRADYRRRDIESLKRMGTVVVQIGIESLSDSHLVLMSKNTCVEDNIRILRDCRDLETLVVWGLFVGHPEENVEQLVEVLEAMKVIHHLPPPKYVTHCEIRAGSQLWSNIIHSRQGTISFPFRCFDGYLDPKVEFSELLPSHLSLLKESDPQTLSLIGEIEKELQRWNRAFADGASRRVITASGILEVIEPGVRYESHISPELVVAIRGVNTECSPRFSGALATEAVASGLAIRLSNGDALMVADRV